MTAWPASASTLGQPVAMCQGAPTTQVRFSTAGWLGQPDVHWEGSPEGSFQNGRRNCGEVDSRWVLQTGD